MIRSLGAGALLGFMAAAIVPIALAAQGSDASSVGARLWSAHGEIGGSAGATWISGAGAPRVTSGTGFLFGAGVSRALNRRSRLDPFIGAVARVDVQPIDVTEREQSWSGGTLSEYDAMATLGILLPGAKSLRIRADAGAGAAILSGADRVLPFNGTGSVAPRLEGSLTLAMASTEGTRRDIALVVRYGSVRVTAADPLTTISDGWSGRLSVALRLTR